jgi:hypothetical protein
LWLDVSVLRIKLMTRARDGIKSTETITPCLPLRLPVRRALVTQQTTNITRRTIYLAHVLGHALELARQQAAYAVLAASSLWVQRVLQATQKVIFHTFKRTIAA